MDVCGVKIHPNTWDATLPWGKRSSTMNPRPSSTPASNGRVTNPRPMTRSMEKQPLQYWNQQARRLGRKLGQSYVRKYMFQLLLCCLKCQGWSTTTPNPICLKPLGRSNNTCIYIWHVYDTCIYSSPVLVQYHLNIIWDHLYNGHQWIILDLLGGSPQVVSG